MDTPMHLRETGTMTVHLTFKLTELHANPNIMAQQVQRIMVRALPEYLMSMDYNVNDVDADWFESITNDQPIIWDPEEDK
jgi:hypothetical protein